MQSETGGMPASTERSAEKWQYWHDIVNCPACVSCGNWIGWEVGSSSPTWATGVSTGGRLKPTVTATRSRANVPADTASHSLRVRGVGIADPLAGR